MPLGDFKKISFFLRPQFPRLQKNGTEPEPYHIMFACFVVCCSQPQKWRLTRVRLHAVPSPAPLAVTVAGIYRQTLKDLKNTLPVHTVGVHGNAGAAWKKTTHPALGGPSHRNKQDGSSEVFLCVGVHPCAVGPVFSSHLGPQPLLSRCFYR